MSGPATDLEDVNKFQMERSELHITISKRFASSRFSFMTQDDVEDPAPSHSQPYIFKSYRPESADRVGRRRSPRRSDRYPIYVLNLTIPPEEVDLVYDPKKRMVGYGVRVEHSHLKRS